MQRRSKVASTSSTITNTVTNRGWSAAVAVDAVAVDATVAEWVSTITAPRAALLADSASASHLTDGSMLNTFSGTKVE